MNCGKTEIIVESGALKRAGEIFSCTGKVLILTDDGVPGVYAETVAESLKKQGAVPFIQVMLAGENHKNLQTVETLLGFMLEKQFGRKDAVVTVGGGLVSDLGGLVASLYMRGVPAYFVPTTLLSMADASFGGKTGVNFGGIKNAIGAFYPAEKVLMDPDTLKTLDKRIFAEGMAEIIKMAATLDSALFGIFETLTTEGLMEKLEDIIKWSVALKTEVVEKDPKEQGLRRVLNFGHTIGHAVEALGEGKYLHGESVAIGMIPMCSEATKDRLKKVLEKFDLETEISASKEDILAKILHDKKSVGTKVYAVLLKEIGQFEMVLMTPEEVVERI